MSQTTTMEILEIIRERARAESARQATSADLQKNGLVRQQIRARADALAEVAQWIDSEIEKI